MRSIWNNFCLRNQIDITPLVILVVAFTLVFASKVWSAETLYLGADKDEFALTKNYLSYAEDSQDQLRIDDITQQSETFKPAPSDVVDFGVTSNSIWVHFAVMDQSSDELAKMWLLEIDYSMLKRVDIYIQKEKSAIEKFNIGYQHPMLNRVLPYRFYVQPLTLEPNTRYDIYINAKRENGNIKIPIKLTRPLKFISTEIHHNMLLGVLLGLIVAMAIYNFFVYMSVGEAVYLYYIAFILFACVSILGFTGYGALFFWGNYPKVNDYILAISICLATISGIRFFWHFVRQEFHSRAVQRIVNSFIAAGVVLILVKVLSGRYLGMEIAIYFGTMSLIMPVVNVYCWRKGSRSAGFFTISWSLFWLCSIIFFLGLYGFLPTNLFTSNAMLFGTAAEVLLLSWGLADRINRLKRAEFKALQEKHETTLQLKDAEDRLLHRSYHKGNTGLPNGNLLETVMNEKFNPDTSQPFSLLLVHLHNFHEISKTLGHTNAVAALNQFIAKLKPLSADLPSVIVLEEVSHEKIYLASIEGSTFAVLLNELDPTALREISARLISEIEKPFAFHDLSLHIEACVGIASFPIHADSGELLLRNTHIALEAASFTSDKIAVYTQDIDPYNERRISLIGNLKQAIENNELELHFQPQISLEDFSVTGVEALIRWSHPEYGFIPPDEFIPLAERTGAIHDLTRWVVQEAFQFKHQLDILNLKIDLSLNISARNLQAESFKEQVCEIASQYNINLNEVIMELTETAIMNDPKAAETVMRGLSEQGVRLSIDDFGTGHASLSYIRGLPVNELKIDRSFVMEMVQNHDDQVIVNTTILMGHNLNLAVVAEGIEDELTLLKLKEMGCDYAQGYFISRPIPSTNFVDWLNDYKQAKFADIIHKAQL